MPTLFPCMATAFARRGSVFFGGLENRSAAHSVQCELNNLDDSSNKRRAHDSPTKGLLPALLAYVMHVDVSGSRTHHMGLWEVPMVGQKL